MSLKVKQVNFDDVWPQLKNVIKTVLSLGHVTHSVWKDSLTDIYDLCVFFPEPLGDKLFQDTRHYLDNHVKLLLEEVQSTDEGLLVAYHKHWLKYKKGIGYLNHLYCYLNSQLAKKQKFRNVGLLYGCPEPTEQVLEIGELGLELWKRKMIEPLQENLIHLLLEGIKKDRLGDSPNQTVFHGVIQSLVEVEGKQNPLRLYQKIFETPFLLDTGEYLRLKASELLLETDCSQYMEKVLQKVDAENLRSRKYLHPSSYPKVTEECEQRMVADHLQFFHGECKRMVQQENQKDLQHMYLLLKSIPDGLDALKIEVQQCITKIGFEATNSLKCENSPQLFVESLFEVHDKYHNLIKDVFNSDEYFVDALKKACGEVINFRRDPKITCKSPELVAKYCDSLLKKSLPKKSSKCISESEVKDKLSQCITVFKYIDDKDVFQKFYTKMLAKRLIYGHSKSRGLEEFMTDKLMQTCGCEFTSKLEFMFRDMSVSADLNEKFTTFLQSENTNLGINFSIAVLQAGAWPFSASAVSPFEIPQELEKSVQKFETFYNTEFKGRKLAWLHHCSTVELKLCYLKKQYIVTMNTYQMALLLLYEGTDAVSYNEMKDATKLNVDQLNIQIQSLIESKLILTDNDSKEVTSSVFRLNKKYSNGRTKFKINVVIQKEASQQEVEKIHKSVVEDRKTYVEAAIVRIMKTHKVLSHNALIQEAIKHSKSRFSVKIPLIKKCIEDLIKNNYLERTPHSADEYSYVA